MKLLEFYPSQLESLGFVIENDKLNYADDGTPAYFTYNKEKRRMVLPTNAMLKVGMEDEGRECHAYHPLCESVLTGESGTIRFLKKAITARVWKLSMELIDAILITAAENKSVRLAGYKKFLADLCVGIKDPKMDKTLLSSWKTLKEYVGENVDVKKRIRMYISTDMAIEGHKYVRVASYTHMFEEEGEDDTATYFGAKLQRKQDKIILHRLLTTIFGWYPSVCGSNDNRPYFGCLSRGWAQYVLSYNQIVKGLRDHTPLRPLNDEWIAQLDHMHIYDGVIPTLPYNTGSKSTNPEQDTTNQEYRLAPQQAYQEPAAKTVTQKETDSTDPMAFLRAKGIGASASLLGGVEERNLTPVQQRLLKETGSINPAASESINNISLASIYNTQNITPQTSLLGSGNSGSLLGGNSGGLINTSGGDSLLGGNSGSLLGGNNGSLLGSVVKDPFMF